MVNKSGAIEMSISTIVVIVIAVTMLVFGIVFVKGIMCSSIALTSSVSDNAQKEINKLFGASGGEIQCVGSGEPVNMIPGRYNVVYCLANAPEVKEYTFDIVSIKSDKLDESQIESWVVGDKGGSYTISPNDQAINKILTLNIPVDADKQIITIKVNVEKGGKVFKTQNLDFVTNSLGVIKSAMC